MDFDDFPMSLEKAGESLMEGRKWPVSFQESTFENIAFSLCEH
jgi:hypothetical protein